jgi:hypothetical protein
MTILCAVFLILHGAAYLSDNLAAGIFAIAIRQIVLIVVLLYLFLYGRMRHTWWRLPACLLAGLYIVARLYRAAHWVGGYHMTIIAITGFPLVYALWFAVKKPKTTNDKLKLAAIVYLFGAACTDTFITDIAEFWVADVSALLLTGVLWHFHGEQSDRESAARQNWDFEGSFAASQGSPLK